MVASAGSFLLTPLFPPKAPEAGADAAPAGGPGTSAPQTTPAPLDPPRVWGAEVALVAPEGAVGRPAAASLDAAMTTVVQEAGACASDHAAALAPLEGRVDIRTVIGPGGVVGATVRDLESLDAAPAACLAGVIWTAPWPAVAGEQAVTFPIYVVPPLERPPAPPED